MYIFKNFWFFFWNNLNKKVQKFSKILYVEQKKKFSATYAVISEVKDQYGGGYGNFI